MSYATTSSIHLQFATEPPRVRVHSYTDTPPIAAVIVDDGALTIASTCPADLLLLADALTDAARQLSDELDKAAAREVNAAVTA